jgi:hypothetical protein
MIQNRVTFALVVRLGGHLETTAASIPPVANLLMSLYSTPTNTFTHQPDRVTFLRVRDMPTKAIIYPKHWMSIVFGMKMSVSRHLGSGNSTAMIHSSCQRHRYAPSSASSCAEVLMWMNTSQAHLADSSPEDVDHVSHSTKVALER